MSVRYLKFNMTETEMLKAIQLTAPLKKSIKLLKLKSKCPSLFHLHFTAHIKFITKPKWFFHQIKTQYLHIFIYFFSMTILVKAITISWTVSVAFSSDFVLQLFLSLINYSTHKSQDHFGIVNQIMLFLCLKSSNSIFFAIIIKYKLIPWNTQVCMSRRCLSCSYYLMSHSSLSVPLQSEPQWPAVSN